MLKLLMLEVGQIVELYKYIMHILKLKLEGMGMGGQGRMWLSYTVMITDKKVFRVWIYGHPK